jgi:non-ribosomal peptide synthetase component E (peptide arylation enzyme)
VEQTVREPFEILYARDVYTAEQIAAFKADGRWADTVITDHLARHARERREAIAVTGPNGWRTWLELAQRVDALACGLLELGLEPGDFIGIQLPNHAEFVESYLAAIRIGLRPMTMMTIFRQQDVEYMLRECGARAVIVIDEHRGFDHAAMAVEARGRVPTLDAVVVVGRPSCGAVAYSSLLAAPSGPRLDALRPDPDAVSRLGFTSGTTALPKAVAHTHNTDDVSPRFVEETLGLGPQTPIWMPSPVAHVTGLLFGVHLAMRCGAKLVLQDRWDPAAALEMIARERPVMTVSATPFLAAMLEEVRRRPVDVSCLRHFLSGGAPTSGALVAAAKERLGWDILRVFGQSEAPLHTMNLPGDPLETLSTTDGCRAPWAEIKIVDPADRSIAMGLGEQGEYAVRGPHVFLGYYGDYESTRACRDRDGWYFSGDVCTLDVSDRVRYVDRIKDIVNRGGVKLSALEIENAVARHPAVAQVAVLAEPDERLGEHALAIVVLAEQATLTLDELRDFLREGGVTTQKWPERLVITSTIPVTPTGKVQKAALRGQLGRAAIMETAR